MRTFDVQTIEIKTSPDDAYRYIADRRNLTKWAEAFDQVEGDQAILRTPSGSVEVGLLVEADPRIRNVDWIMTFPDGSIGAARSRVTASVDGTAIYSFVLNAPPVQLEQLEGALSEQSEALKRELATLKGLLEAK